MKKNNNTFWKILLIVLILAPIDQIFAQTDNDNLKKYWQYRYWLKNYYMVVEPDAGMSLPAHHRMKQEVEQLKK